MTPRGLGLRPESPGDLVEPTDHWNRAPVAKDIGLT